jgi:dTDP-4-dehydrorhamnose 3,5-epimerase
MLSPKCYLDERGSFVKVYSALEYAHLGLVSVFVEDFYSTSRQNVVRGMHFQRPPFDQAKLVYCLSGRTLDVMIDLRVGSPTYGHSAQFELNAESPSCIYIPSGVAHGFCSLSESATLCYKVSAPYVPSHDDGIAWDSIGVAWPVAAPILSDRDRSFVRLADYRSPFTYGQ